MLNDQVRDAIQKCLEQPWNEPEVPKDRDTYCAELQAHPIIAWGPNVIRISDKPCADEVRDFVFDDAIFPVTIERPMNVPRETPDYCLRLVIALDRLIRSQIPKTSGESYHVRSDWGSSLKRFVECRAAFQSPVPATTNRTLEYPMDVLEQRTRRMYEEPEALKELFDRAVSTLGRNRTKPPILLFLYEGWDKVNSIPVDHPFAIGGVHGGVWDTIEHLAHPRVVHIYAFEHGLFRAPKSGE